MNIKISLDLALVRAWGRSVYADRERVGAVHPTDSISSSDDAGGRIVGSCGKEQNCLCGPRRCSEARMSDRKERLLATISINSYEELRIVQSDYEGISLISFQVWFKDRDTSELRPGQGRPRLSPRVRRQDHRRPSGCEG